MTRRVSSPRFVGRERELARLRGLLDEALGGRPGLAFISGEAGVGKTRLIEELATEARRQRVRVLIGHCQEFGAERLPLAPMADVIRQIRRELSPPEFERIAGPAAPLASLLSPELGAPDPDGLSDVQDAVGLFERLAGATPLVLAFEDLHWSDASTRNLLALLARTIDRGPFLVIGTYRSDELPRLHPLRPVLAELYRAVRPERIDLEPLGRAEVRDLVRAIAGDAADDSLVEHVWQHSQGNSFYAEELLAAALAGHKGLPGSLRDVVEARLAALGPDARTVARAAALEPVIEPLLVARITGLDAEQADHAFEELVDAGLFKAEDHRFEFRHALVREVVDATVAPARRAAMHLAYAEALIGTNPQRRGDIARHYWEAGVHREALAAAVAAGNSAMRLGAPDEALIQYQRALTLWDRVEDAEDVAGTLRHRLLGRAAAMATNAREFTEAARLLEEAIAIAEAEQPRDVSRLWRQLAWVRWGANLQGIAEAAETGLETLPADVAIQERAQALGSYVLSSVAIRGTDVVEPAAQEADELGRGAGDPLAQAWGGLAMATVAMSRGDTRALGHMRHASAQALQARQRDTIGIAQHWNVIAHVAFGLYAEGLQIADEAVRTTKTLGIYGDHGVGPDFNAIHCLARLGDWDVVESRARSVLRRLRFAEEWSDGIAFALGLVTVRRRKLHEARTFLPRGFEIALQPNYGNIRGPIGAALVELRAAGGDWDALCASVEREFELCTPAMVGRLGEPLASALAWLDPAVESHAGMALGWTERYEELEAGAMGDPTHRERERWTAMVRAEATRWRGAHDADPWTALAAMWEVASRPYESAYCSMRAAEALLLQGGQRAGDRAATAATHLRNAHALATRLGALTLGDTIRELARIGRVPLDPSVRAGAPEPNAPNPYGLSDRELEVLRLVADGYSNGEIGRALVISTKTASVHVSNILRKLDVTNRVEAAVLAGRLGLAGGS